MMNKYNKGDKVVVTFERGETEVVTLGKPFKLYNEYEEFLGWAYGSQTEGVSWIAECWIKYKI